jgi:hypothetical protein
MLALLYKLRALSCVSYKAASHIGSKSVGDEGRVEQFAGHRLNRAVKNST